MCLPARLVGENIENAVLFASEMNRKSSNGARFLTSHRQPGY